MADTEIEAMSSLVGALEPLDEGARQRVLRWAAERFEVSLSVQKHRKKDSQVEDQDDDDENDDGAGGPDDESDYADFAELFAAAGPTTEADKALVGGYWFQVVKGQKDIESFQINKELKDVGHRIGTINKAFDTLIGKKPQLAIQLKKSGKARQGRKKYRITTEGIARVQEMLSNFGG